MDELAARAVLVPAPDVQGGVTTSVTRSQIEEVLAQGEKPIELVLDVTRISGEESRETRSVAISWEPEELEQLLREAQGDEVTLTFDRETLEQALDADVEAHGIREKVLVLAVAATAAAGGAATASAMPTGYGAAEAPIVQSGTVPDDRAVARGGPVESPQLGPDDRAVPRSTPSPVETPTPGVLPDDRAVPRGGPVESPALSPDDRAVPRTTPTPVETPTPGVLPDDRAVPRGGPVETPSVSPDDRAVPRGGPISTPTPTPIVSPDDRAFPRSTPVEAPVGGTASDPGISWAPSPAETAALAGAIALMITGAYFVVGGRRRVRPGPA
jgi:hypothetical protein